MWCPTTCTTRARAFDVSSARGFLAAVAALGIASLAMKAVRHADEARVMIGPSARLAVEEVHPHPPYPDALTAAEIAAEKAGGRGKD